MANARGPNVEVSDDEAPAARVVQLQSAWQVAQPYRKQRRGGGSAGGRPPAPRGAGWGPHVEPPPPAGERGRKTPPPDVGPVGGGEPNRPPRHARGGSWSARDRIPVPAWSASTAPSGPVTRTHEVLPP